MAKCIYTNIFLDQVSSFINITLYHVTITQDLCGLLGPCSLSSLALYHHAWECQECRSMIARTAEYLAQVSDIMYNDHFITQ